MASDQTAVRLQLVNAVNVSFMLLTGTLILIMQIGFMALEVGGSRIKNVKSLLFKNFMDHAAGSLSWFGFGYGIYQGDSPFAGGLGASFLVHNIGSYVHLFNQFAFAATASTIISGAVTGRCRIEPYVIMSFLITGFIYPLGAHWGWNPSGWLYKMGFLDFAGSCVVHLFGGACALAAAWLCGPRVGLFVGPRRKSTNTERTNASSQRSSSNSRFATLFTQSVELCRRIPLYQTRKLPQGHNPALMVIGSLLLYCAWFGFNTSQQDFMFSPDSSSRSSVNTLLASAAGSTTMFVITKLFRWKFDVAFACNSSLTSLVAITAPCAFIDPWAAVVVGIFAAPVYLFSTFFVLRVLGVDDTISAISVHFSGGMLGTLWLGLTHPQKGLFYGGGLYLFGVQLLGCVAIGALGFVATFIILLPFKLTNRISYTASEQLVGIDYVHFGGIFGKDVDLESEPTSKTPRMLSEASYDSANSDDDDTAIARSVSPYGQDISQHSNRTQEGRLHLNDELKRVLDEDPRMRRRFRAFLEVEHRDEGVEFWDAVNKFKSMSKGKKLTAKANEARKIIKTYCLESGSRQVNLSSSVLKQLTSALNDKQERLADNDLFDPALDELFKDLKLAFAHFVNNTPNYWLQ